MIRLLPSFLAVVVLASCHREPIGVGLEDSAIDGNQVQDLLPNDPICDIAGSKTGRIALTAEVLGFRKARVTLKNYGCGFVVNMLWRGHLARLGFIKKPYDSPLYGGICCDFSLLNLGLEDIPHKQTMRPGEKIQFEFELSQGCDGQDVRAALKYQAAHGPSDGFACCDTWAYSNTVTFPAK